MNNVRKGTNTFQSYQEEKLARRETLIRNWVKVARKSRAKYEYVTDLAKAVAAHIAQLEAGNCNHATLLRNKRYKALLLSYMAESITPDSKGSRKQSVESRVTNGDLTLLQLEASNLRQENQRLKTYVAELEDKIKLSMNKELVVSVDQSKLTSHVDEAVALMKKYVSTSQTLLLVLEHMNALIAVDQEKMQILDATRLRNNVIVDTRLAEPFFKWLKTQPKQMVLGISGS